MFSFENLCRIQKLSVFQFEQVDKQIDVVLLRLDSFFYASWSPNETTGHRIFKIQTNRPFVVKNGVFVYVPKLGKCKKFRFFQLASCCWGQILSLSIQKCAHLATELSKKQKIHVRNIDQFTLKFRTSDVFQVVQYLPHFSSSKSFVQQLPLSGNKRQIRSADEAHLGKGRFVLSLHLLREGTSEVAFSPTQMPFKTRRRSSQKRAVGNKASSIVNLRSIFEMPHHHADPGLSLQTTQLQVFEQIVLVVVGQTELRAAPRHPPTHLATTAKKQCNCLRDVNAQFNC